MTKLKKIARYKHLDLKPVQVMVFVVKFPVVISVVIPLHHTVTCQKVFRNIFFTVLGFL